MTHPTSTMPSPFPRRTWRTRLQDLEKHFSGVEGPARRRRFLTDSLAWSVHWFIQGSGLLASTAVVLTALFATPGDWEALARVLRLATGTNLDSAFHHALMPALVKAFYWLCLGRLAWQGFALTHALDQAAQRSEPDPGRD